MKPYLNTTLGLMFSVQVPETAEEFDNLAGVKNQCVTEANRNVIYRTVNHEFREAFCERLEKETGVPRERKTTKKADGTELEEFDETEKTYYNRLLSGKHITEDMAQLLANEIGKELVFDPSPTTRSSKIPKEITAAANDIWAAVESGATTAKTVASKFEVALSITDFEGTFGPLSVDSIVKALIADREKQARERSSRFV